MNINEYDQDKPYRITYYNNGTARVDYHVYEPFMNRQVIVRPKRTNEKKPYMTVDQYKKTLKRKRKEYHLFDLKKENCLFVTLTYADSSTWESINKEFQVFIRNIKRHFKGTKYIRSFEPYSRKTGFHIHILLIFPDEVPPEVNTKWIKKYWTFGRVDIKRTWDPYGVIEYMTLFKTNALNKGHADTLYQYTHYPEWVSILSSSHNIPKLQVVKTERVDKKKLEKYRKQFIDKHKAEYKKTNMYFDYHAYIDELFQRHIECLDREYWR